MSTKTAEIAKMIDMLPDSDKELAYELIKKLVLAWDPDYTKVTEQEYKDIAEARVAKLLENRQIGNINSKDWVNTISIGLSYSFGRPPCYCD